MRAVRRPDALAVGLGQLVQRVETPAAQQLVNGLLLPRAVAGHSALELCNTVAGWGSDGTRDYLESYAHLVALVRSLRLITPSQVRRLTAMAETDPRAAARALGDVRRFRADLYAALTGTLDAESELPRLNRVLTSAAAARSIESTTVRGTRWGFGEVGLRLPLVVLAWQAHQLLDDSGGVLPERVRACPGDGCGWLFVDPRGQRRWCVMSLCGNRAKARRHRQST
jgi:predicted RNA-binding Zn ribbon-like protein